MGELVLAIGCCSCHVPGLGTLLIMTKYYLYEKVGVVKLASRLRGCFGRARMVDRWKTRHWGIRNGGIFRFYDSYSDDALLDVLPYFS